MPKSKKPKSKPGKWYEQLDQEEVDAAFEEATVDAYEADEQLSGLFNAIGEELVFPWQASVLGEVVMVVDIEQPNDDKLGLDLVVERNGKQFRIEARSVDVLLPLPEGHLYLAAYLVWKRTL